MSETAAATLETEPTRFSTGLTGLFLFLVSETFFFGSLFGSYFYFMGFTKPWPPHGSPTIDVAIGAVNTVILVTSGGFMHWAHLAIQKGKNKQMVIGLGLTILLGVMFLCGQAIEYRNLIFVEHGTLASGAWIQFFLTMTGFHGLHVTGGVIFLIIVFYRARKGQFTKEHHLAVETCAWYWHFVDAVWIVLFCALYIPFYHAG